MDSAEISNIIDSQINLNNLKIEGVKIIHNHLKNSTLNTLNNLEKIIEESKKKIDLNLKKEKEIVSNLTSSSGEQFEKLLKNIENIDLEGSKELSEFLNKYKKAKFEFEKGISEKDITTSKDEYYTLLKEAGIKEEKIDLIKSTLLSVVYDNKKLTREDLKNSRNKKYALSSFVNLLSEINKVTKKIEVNVFDEVSGKEVSEIAREYQVNEEVLKDYLTFKMNGTKTRGFAKLWSKYDLWKDEDKSKIKQAYNGLILSYLNINKSPSKNDIKEKKDNYSDIFNVANSGTIKNIVKECLENNNSVLEILNSYDNRITAQVYENGIKNSSENCLEEMIKQKISMNQEAIEETIKNYEVPSNHLSFLINYLKIKKKVKQPVNARIIKKDMMEKYKTKFEPEYIKKLRLACSEIFLKSYFNS